MKIRKLYSVINLFILNACLILPMTSFARHLIQITPISPFPPTINASSKVSASYQVTNMTSHTPVTVIDQSQFPAGSGLSISSNTCGVLMGPGQSCLITLQLNAPQTAQTISAELKEWASPFADGVLFPIVFSVVNQVFVPVVVGYSEGAHQLPAAYTSSDTGLNWTLSPPFELQNNITDALLQTAVCKANFCISVGYTVQSATLPLVYMSSDGGKNWILSDTPPLPNGVAHASLSSVSCISHGCAAVGSSLGVKTLPLAYGSNDRGKTWVSSSPLELPVGFTEGQLNSVSCTSTICTAVGTTIPNTPLVYTSHDGGLNWILSPALPFPADRTGGVLTGVACKNSRCIASGQSVMAGSLMPIAYSSSDNGVHWTISNGLILPSGQTFGGLLNVKCSNIECIAVGRTQLPLAYMSKDYGVNWTLLPEFPLPSGQTGGLLHDVYCVNNQCISAGSSFSISGAHTPLVYISSDGGNSWMLSNALTLPNGQTMGHLLGVTIGTM